MRLGPIIEGVTIVLTFGAAGIRGAGGDTQMEGHGGADGTGLPLATRE